MKIQEQAPAKINLTLDILGRRSDGYHELRMVMQSVSLCDTVTVEETGTGFTLLADGFTVPAGKSSLEQQAAEAFFAAVGRPMSPLTVHLEKTTPAYAGLGGGSADVAALLRCLRRQYAPEMPVEQLRAIGLTVGSDMPFCVSGGTALFCPPKHFHFADPKLQFKVEGDEITVSASAYARSVEITCDDGDVLLSDNYFDLNADSRTVKILRGTGSKFRVRSVYDIR